MRTTIFDVFAADAYVRVNSEEGPYDAHAGYNVFAKTCEEGEYTSVWIYTGESDLPALFDLEGAAKVVDLIKEKGSINSEAYWDCVETKRRNEYPDYVTNWWRPEYN